MWRSLSEKPIGERAAVKNRISHSPQGRSRRPSFKTRKPPGSPETLVFLCSCTAALSERRFPALLSVPSGPCRRKAGSVPIAEDDTQACKFNGLTIIRHGRAAGASTRSVQKLGKVQIPSAKEGRPLADRPSPQPRFRSRRLSQNSSQSCAAAPAAAGCPPPPKARAQVRATPVTARWTLLNLADAIPRI